MKDLYRLLRNLRNRERGVQPDDAWVSATRERLLMQVRNSMPTKETAKKNRRYLLATRKKLFSAMRGPIMTAASILIVILGGSLMSVRAAEYALPGDVLYTVKLVTEQTRLALEASKAEKVRLKLEFTKRRVEDLKTIMNEPDARKAERVNKAADILKQDLHTLKKQIEDSNDQDGLDKDVLDSVKVVDKEVVEVAKVLRDADKSDLDTETVQKMADAEAQAADVGLQALAVLVNAKANQNEAEITDEEISESLRQHTSVVQETVASVLALTSSTEPVVLSDDADDDAQTSSTGSIISAQSVTAPKELAEGAETGLQEVQALLETDKMIEAILKLKEVTANSFTAQTELQRILSSSVTNGTSDSLDTASSTDSGTEVDEDLDSTTSTSG